MNEKATSVAHAAPMTPSLGMSTTLVTTLTAADVAVMTGRMPVRRWKKMTVTTVM